MPEHMRSDVLADVGKLGVAVYHKADGLIGEPMLQSIYKEKAANFDIFHKSFLVQIQGGEDIRVADLQDSFPGALSVDQDIVAF